MMYAAMTATRSSTPTISKVRRYSEKSSAAKAFTSTKASVRGGFAVSPEERQTATPATAAKPRAPSRAAIFWGPVERAVRLSRCRLSSMTTNRKRTTMAPV
jgi:hypothetical protein